MWQRSHRRISRLAAPVGLAGLLVGVAPSPLAEAPAPPPTSVSRTPIGERGTFLAALLRQGLELADASRIVAGLGGLVDFTRVRPGDTIEVTKDAQGTVLGVTYRASPWNRYEVWRRGQGWVVRSVSIPVAARVEPLSGTVRTSLFDSMDRLGEDPRLVLKFVEIFAWDFDFAADSWPGDRFRLLVEKRYAGGEFVEYGRILIAQYEHEGRRLTAVAFTTEAGRTGFYGPDGRSMRKSFLRSPLEFTRITSGYSLGRRHPVLGGVRPHLAVDYAAPVGTPVQSVADGVVTLAGWNGGYGISVSVRHRAGYETMYNHLSRVGQGVRRGARLAQGQVVGYVGSTGLSTGPHLDYRVMRGGSFVNPVGEKFLPGAPVPAPERASFFQVRDALLKRLDQEASFPLSSH
jgi:murein DD-endopeptidase MepM/ murein hydrolase activator NlpD